jgi:hypothetical protein
VETPPSFNGAVPANPNNRILLGYIFSYLFTANRGGRCTFTLDYVDATLYTHIVVQYGLFSEGSWTVGACCDDVTSGFYSEIMGLKNRNPNLKVMVSNFEF